MNHYFSSADLRDLARAYKMKLDAKSGNLASLLTDLMWIEDKIDLISSDSNEWLRRLCNIVYANLIPDLWRKQDYSTAIILCAYADNIGYNLDNTCLSFQLMGSLNSDQLISVYNKMKKTTPLYNFLRRKIRKDQDYYYELIGTLALREENYARAEYYLSQVSEKYIRTMNVFKDNYLSRDPFNIYPTAWFDSKSSYLRGNNMAAIPTFKNTDNAKLVFAKKMRAYQQLKQNGRTADERGLARLMYAIGRYNSYNNCWALTQYWDGWVGLFEPDLCYWDSTFRSKNYAFLYNYSEKGNTYLTYATYRYEQLMALSMLTSDDARAEANYILGNLATIINRYPDTPAAQYIKTSCDHWRSWL